MKLLAKIKQRQVPYSVFLQSATQLQLHFWNRDLVSYIRHQYSACATLLPIWPRRQQRIQNGLVFNELKK